MTSHTCSIAGCEREAEANGMCSAHFTAALVHGVFHPTHRRTAAGRVVGMRTAF